MTEIARRVLRARPGVKGLQTLGDEERLGEAVAPESGAALLRNPFAPDSLSRRG